MWCSRRPAKCLGTADSVEKVDLERSPAIREEFSFDNALNLLMRKISRSRIPGAKQANTEFFNRIGQEQSAKRPFQFAQQRTLAAPGGG
jgi:hypothetical protein